MSKEKKKTTYVTPNGKILFAHVHSVDYGTEKFPVPQGQYALTLVLDEDQSQALTRKLEDEYAKAEAFADEQFAKLKPATRNKIGKVKLNELCTPEYDKEDNPTGNYLWRFKTNAFIKSKATGEDILKKVPVFDSIGQPVKLKEEPGNGSIAKIAFVTNPYFVEGQGMGGLSLYLNAVQLLKLEQFGARDAASYGFGVEDGFEYEADSEENTEQPDSLPVMDGGEIDDVPF